LRAPCLLVLLALLPFAPAHADSATGGSEGVNGGYVDVGAWDLFEVDAGGGVLSISLDWGKGLVPFGADYDLRLYPPGSLDDGVLDENPVAVSERRSFNEGHEGIDAALPPGRYVLAVVPWQAQGETYVLRANGSLTVVEPPAPGVEVTYPF
jgi:hypothetical protein